MTPEERAERAWRHWDFSTATREEDIAAIAAMFSDAERAAAAAVAEEREACAVLAEAAARGMCVADYDRLQFGPDIAAAIRARSDNGLPR